MTGRGVPAHERDAARFIDASARQGWPAAQFYLGEMFRNGWGVPKSIPEAYVWFSIAARSSNILRSAPHAANTTQNTSRTSCSAALGARVCASCTCGGDNCCD